MEKMYGDFDDTQYASSQFSAVTVYYHISNGYKVAFSVFKDGGFIGAGIRDDLNNLNNIYQYINEVINSFQENIIKKYTK